MEIKIFFLFCISVFQLHAQSIEEKVRDSFCECIKETFKEEGEISFNCNQQLILAYGNEIDNHLSEKKSKLDSISNPNSMTKQYESIPDFVTDIFESNQQYFLKNCGAYFNRISQARSEGLGKFFAKCDGGEIERLTEIIEEVKPNFGLLRNRGKCYIAEKKYDSAVLDLEQCLSQNPSDYEALFFKAWALEMNRSFKDASQIYFKIYDLTNEPGMKMSGELTKFLANNKI